jgi:hypothetical protein
MRPPFAGKRFVEKKRVAETNPSWVTVSCRNPPPLEAFQICLKVDIPRAREVAKLKIGVD